MVRINLITLCCMYEQVGLDSGDGVNSFVIARSRTAGIVDIDMESNSGVVGRYMFRTDMSDVIATTVEENCQDNGCIFSSKFSLFCKELHVFLMYLLPLLPLLHG